LGDLILNRYVEQEWYSVIYKATGEKKCDCGWECDAMMIVSMNPEKLTYVKSNNHLMGQVVDVTPPPALPTNEIVDLGGKWDDPIPEGIDPYNLRGRQPIESVKKKLKPSELKEFEPE